MERKCKRLNPIIHKSCGNICCVTICLFFMYLFQFNKLICSSGQEEVRYPNGALEISFADGSVKKIAKDGSENISFPDGTQVVVQSNGDRTMFLANGQKEIHTSEYKVS